MKFWHITPTDRVASICSSGLHARWYSRYPVLLGKQSRLQKHINEYSRWPRCRRDPQACTLIQFDIPDSKLDEYVAHKDMRPTYTFEHGETRKASFHIPDRWGYWAIRKPIPPEYIDGLRTLAASKFGKCSRVKKPSLLQRFLTKTGLKPPSFAGY